MENIICAFDGLRFSESTKEYAIFLAKLHNAHLVGVFLDDFTRRGYKVYETVVLKGTPIEQLKELNEIDKETRKLSVEKFERACQEAGLNYSVHRDPNFAIRELLHESVFADLMVINYHETFSNRTEEPPTHIIDDLLSDVQCPVFLVPNKYNSIEKLLLLYDGKPSSVHAIKMFSYLLPNLKHLETNVISVKPPKESHHMPDNRLVKEFMKRHFPKADYTVLSGYPEEEIVQSLRIYGGNSLVVCGAYRRSAISMFFNQSIADTLMREVKMPLFIAHNK
ncbi:universal stress protein [Solitalea lacus]|uniref:universal stress protein n=1 Tax=Solitalea lacus TaxID=2911172 RepID=UPI001EDA5FA6|nr:universal stress protein [Solitalea lacus]UKJ06692.1 universal stress protein [Solitalea lacus]